MPLSKSKLFYRRAGKGNPVLLLHGILFDSRGYKELLECLARKYSVYAVDLPGHGSSPLIASPSIEKFSKQVHLFVKEMRIKQPIVCAHSGGALVAMMYAQEHAVKALWLLDPAGCPTTPSKVFRSLIFRSGIKFYLQHPIRIFRASAISRQNFMQYMRNKQLFNMIKVLPQMDFSPIMKKLRCPTTLFWGKYDSVVPYSHAKYFLRNIKKSKLITINHNHDWPVLNPGLITPYV